MGGFSIPVIAVRIAKPDHAAKYWTPNGNHRLSAAGGPSISRSWFRKLLPPIRFSALNTEKAHNLREKALEVIRMYRELAQLDHVTEDTYALEFEEPALITLGLCYEERPRFSGGAYHPVLKRVDEFLQKPLHAALSVRQHQAKTVLALDDRSSNKSKPSKPRG